MSRNFAKLTVSDIGIDYSYQRELDESRVNAMAKAFDESRIGVPVVSIRKDGSYVVLDAQHRLEAMRRAGHQNMKVMCEVHNGLSLKDEATLYLKLNGGRKAVGTHDRYKARLTAHEPIAIEFTKIVESLGLRLGRVGGKATICAIHSIETVHRRRGNLEITLSVLKRWGAGDIAAFDGELIKDMSGFLLNRKEEIDTNDLVSRLNRIDPGHVLRKIKAMSDAVNDRDLAADTVLRDIYNRGRPEKNRLKSFELTATN